MTAKTNQQALDRLADVLIEDILSTPADQLLVEVAEDYGNPRALAATCDKIVLRARCSNDRLVTKASPIPASELLGGFSLEKRPYFAGRLRGLWQSVIPLIFDVIFPNRLAMITISSACVASLGFVIAAPTVFNWIQARNSGIPTGTEVFDGAPAGPQPRAPVQEREVANERGVTRGLYPDAPPPSPAVPRVLDLPSAAGHAGMRSDAAATGTDGSKSGSSVAPPIAAQRSASVSTPAADNYVVQVSLERRKADAEAFIRNLQVKLPKELGDHKATVRRADLGPNGVYYRALVGPFGSAGDADRFCSSLKAAGGQCTVQKE
jgi:hypothetical protein